MFNTFSARKAAAKKSAKHFILASCISVLALLANQAWADDHALEIKLSSESKSVKIDHSTEITALVSREKIPAGNAKLRWTQTEGPANASLFPGKAKTNAKGISQLRVLVHTPGNYKFLAEACAESESKTFCEKPAKASFEVEASAPVPVSAEKFLFGAAIAAPAVTGTANLNSNPKLKFASLTAQTSTDINGAVNTNIPLSAAYLYDGAGFIGQSVNWTVTPAASLSNANTPVSSDDGLVGINFQSAASGTFFVTATGTCPANLSADQCAPPTQQYRIRINAPSLVNISGNLQSAGPGLALTAPLVVQAQNAGVGTPGVTIAWTVVSGSASLGAATSATNAVGLASNTVTVGASTGPIVIRAQRSDAASAFVLFNVNAAPGQLDRASPATASGSSSGSFNLTTFSNFAGRASSTGQIYWTSNLPAQTNFSAANTTIDAAGRSNVSVRTTQGGSYLITACWNLAGTGCSAGDPTTTFTLNSNSLRIVSGNSQSLAVSQASAPLTVQLLSGGFANPQTISWTVTGPATLGSASTTTNGTGNSSNTLTFTGAGNAIATAKWPSVGGTGQPTESVSFNLSSSANAYRITPNSSLNIAATIGVASNLSVDYTYNAAAATSLQTQWSIISGPGGGSLGSATSTVAANADSLNTFTPTIAGIYRIRVQGTCPAAADPDCPGNAVEFLVSTATTIKTLRVSSGNGQNTPNSAAFASPLVVLANDNGLPASGVTIDWVVSNGDSTLSSGTSITNGSGLASIDVTAGPSAGISTITATRQDQASAFATFNLSVGTNTYTLVANGSNTIDLPLNFGIFLSANYTINGSPALARNVLWNAAQGFLTDTSVAVDSFGDAQTIFYPPNAVGVYTVTANGDCPAIPDPACPPSTETFTINVIDEQLAIDSGDGQSATLATAFASPLQVLATNNGTPVSGVMIDWAITSGSGTFSSTNPSVTNASGIATVTLNAGSVAGAISVSATRQDSFANVTFNLTATGNTYALTTVSSNDITINLGDTATLDVNYVVNGIADTSLQTLWSETGGTLGSTNAPVDSAGNSSNTFTSAVTGDFIVTVDGSCPTSPDPACPIAPVTFSIHVVSTTLTLAIDSGNNQTTALGTSFATPLRVLAENSGVAASGVQINWSLTSGNAVLSTGTSTTDASGFAQISVNATGFAGPIQITAERNDSGNSVVFDLNSTTAARLDVISGDNQSGPPNTTAGAPVVVRLSNGGGIGFPDVNIDWSVLSGSAVVSSGTTLTDGNGETQINFDFGNTPGPLQIQATANSFNLNVITNHTVLAVTRTLNIATGNGQSTIPNTSFSAPLFVLAQNSGSPVSGVTINWLVTSGDATLSAAASTTDGAGNASISVNAGATVGPVVITGTRADDATATVSFTININAAVSALALGRTSGNGQAAFINTAFSSPLIVNATNNGVADAGIIINWVLASGSAALSSGTSTTDATGAANITVSAGATAGPISVTATRADEPTATVTFSLNATPTPNSVLSIVSGNSQSGVIGSPANSPLVVVLRDGFGNAISGQSIGWSVISGPATVSAATSNSDAVGQANTTFTFGTTSGATVIRASAFGGTLTVDFAANAVMVSLAAASGNGQAGPVSTALPVPLTVQVTPPVGVFSAPSSGPRKPLSLSGVPVTFAVTGGGGSISVINTFTNAAGQASTVLTLGPTAGINTVTATVLGGPSTTFSATALTAAVASGLTIVSGNNQVLDPSITSSPLTVELRDSGGAIISGATINWTTTGGTLSTASSVTNASGQASNTIQLNGLGTVQVSATAPAFGSAPVLFNLNVAISNLTGLNPLQTEVANAVDTLCPALATATSLSAQQNDLLQQCQSILGSAGIDPQDTITALDELFSDVALAQANASMLAAQSQFQNLKARIAALRSGTGGTSFGGLALNTPSGSVPIASLVNALNGNSNNANTTANSGDFERWGFFATGSIGRGEAEAGSINPAFDYDINGLSAGVDYRMNDRLIVGAALGFTQQGTKLPGSDGSVDTKGWSASAYSTFYQQNNWYADAVMTYGKNNFELQRHISYTLPLFGGGFTTVDQIANADTDGSMLSAAFTFGRDFQKGGLAIGPYGRLVYTKLDFDAYDEILLNGNGSGLGLHISERSLTSVATVIGSKFAYSHSTDWGVLMPHLQIEWEREFKDDPQTIQASFIYDPTNTLISVTGDPLDKSFFRIGLGLSMILSKGRSGFIYYEKMIGRDKLDQDNLSLGLRMEF
jgi:uncharacterized protein YhjY with autotransporter beta-barrel domain